MCLFHEASILVQFSDAQCVCVYVVQLVAVHLVDSTRCSDPGNFISALLTSLTTMLQMELPHINLLSKVDVIEKYGKLREQVGTILLC